MNILLYGKGEIKVTAAIKVASQLTLRYRDYSGLSGWTQGNHKNFKNGKGWQKREKQRLYCLKLPSLW